MKLTLKQYMMATQLNKKIKREIRNCTEFEEDLAPQDRLSYKLIDIKTKLQMHMQNGKSCQDIGKQLEQITELYKNRDRQYWIDRKKVSERQKYRQSVILDKNKQSRYSRSPKNSQIGEINRVPSFNTFRDKSGQKTISGRYTHTMRTLKDGKNQKTAAQSVYQPSKISDWNRDQSTTNRQLKIPKKTYTDMFSGPTNNPIQSYRAQMQKSRLERESKLLSRIQSSKITKYQQPRTFRQSQTFNNRVTMLKSSRTLTPRSFSRLKNQQ